MSAEAVCTVVIPSRNCIDYLPTALGTIDLQRVDGLQVIVVDDGSTDGTGAWLAAAPRVNAQLEVISTGGVGVAKARNIAMASAKSDLIAFLDADDQWWPGKLASQIDWHRNHPQVGLSFTDFVHVTPDGRTHGTCSEFWRQSWGDPAGGFALFPNAEAELLATNLVGTSTVMVRKSVFDQVGGFSAACKSAEDWDLWLRMAARAPVGCSAAVTMTYLMRPNGETSARDRRIAAMADIIARYEDRRDGGFPAAVKIAHARLAVAEAETLTDAGQAVNAACAYARSLAKAPSMRVAKAAVASVLRAAFVAPGKRPA